MGDTSLKTDRFVLFKTDRRPYTTNCRSCDIRFEDLDIRIYKNKHGNNLYCEKCFSGTPQPLTVFIPATIRKKYDTQKNLQYSFIFKDGSIELSKFALQHSDFYSEQCEGSDLSLRKHT